MSTFTNAQKAKCILWLAKYDDIEVVQEKFWKESDEGHSGIKIPTKAEIRQWYGDFYKTGVLTENSQASGENTNFNEEAKKNNDVPSVVDLHTTEYEKETGILNFFGFKKIHKCHMYKMHLKEQFKEEDKESRKNFATHKVYEKPIENDDDTELGNRIHYAFTEIMPEMLEAAVEAYKSRLKMVVDTHGDFVDVHDDDEDGNKKIPKWRGSLNF
uniref:Uncharacterized protein n=1 Tax=Acrobeloides nanus TaxID=290746 RepID=A0A914E0C7_9BILA